MLYSAGAGGEHSDAGGDLVRPVLRHRVRDEGSRHRTPAVAAHRRRLGRRRRRLVPAARLPSPDDAPLAQPHRDLVRRRLASRESTPQT